MDPVSNTIKHPMGHRQKIFLKLYIMYDIIWEQLREIVLCTLSRGPSV
jgi:hypothetical protein